MEISDENAPCKSTPLRCTGPSAELHRLFDYHVDILDLQEEREGRPFNTSGLRRLATAVGIFILDNENRIANRDLGVGDRPAWTREAHLQQNAPGSSQIIMPAAGR